MPLVLAPPAPADDATTRDGRTAGWAVVGSEEPPQHPIKVNGSAESALHTESGDAQLAPAGGVPPEESHPLPLQETQPLGVPRPAVTTGPRAAHGSGHPLAALVWRNELVRVGVALSVVVGLLLLLRLALRRFGGPLNGAGRPSGIVEVLARYPVARAQQLILLKLGGRLVLLHQSRGAMTTLSEVEDPDEVAALLARVEAPSGLGRAQRFSGLLKRLLAEQRPAINEEVASPGNEVIDLTRRSGGPAFGFWRRGIR